MKEKKSYTEKLKDPRWQKKRLKILERDNWMCKYCSDDENTLHVHHFKYEKGRDPWEYEDEDLITLCEKCHAIDPAAREFFSEILLETFRNMPPTYLACVAMFFRDPEKFGFDKDLPEKILDKTYDLIDREVRSSEDG